MRTGKCLTGLILGSVFFCAQVAYAANYPLEITNIRAGMSPDNRLARAYPGLEYNVRAAVVGGLFPYVYSLTNAPAGMTINPTTGEILWPNPQSSATPTLTVVDAEGTRVTQSWTITVTTSRFRFIDAVNGRSAANGGTGTAANPWRTVLDMHNNAGPAEAVYFRNGTYRVTDLPRTGTSDNPWQRVVFYEARNPVIFLAYPGESPVIDFAHSSTENGPLIRFRGENIYVDGFQTINSNIMAFQMEGDGGNGPTVRRMRMHQILGVSGTNAAFIMTLTNPSVSNYMVVQDSEFSGVVGEGVAIKIYAQNKLLIEDNLFRDSTVALELKEDVRRFTVRKNTLHTISRTAIGGNMHDANTHGEILFNNSRGTVALDLNQNGMAGVIHVYRNTLVGRAQVRNTDGSDGPFYLYNNVIVNSDSGTGQ